MPLPLPLNFAMPKRSPVRSVRAYAFRAGEAPAEIQLWNVGDNATDYGVHRWTDRSVLECFGRYEDRGNPIQIDVEHNAADGLDAVAPTGGYAKLELRNGAPWLVFDWSAFAIEQIATRQRLFLSPEYDVDTSTGEIVRLYRVSLVGDPGTHAARMLARSHRAATKETRTMNLAMFLAALRAALSAENPETATQQIAALISEMESAAGAGGEAAPPSAAATAGAADGGMAGDEEDKAKAAAPPPDEEDKTKQAARTAAAAPAARFETPAAVRELARVSATVAELQAKEAARELADRLEPLPETLHTFARTLTASQFAAFVATDEVKKAIAAKAKLEATTGVRASSRATAGATDDDAGELDAETKRHLARAFGTDRRPSAIDKTPDGRIRLSHLSKPETAGKAG